MAKATKSAVTKSTVVENAINSSIGNLADALSNAEKAIATRSSEAKKLAADSKRLGKKRATLLKRKKAAATKVKKSPDAATKKLLRDTEKELGAVVKELAKMKPVKEVNSQELSGLKASLKRAAAYVKGVNSADKVLNKAPKKKKKRRKTKKAA